MATERITRNRTAWNRLETGTVRDRFRTVKPPEKIAWTRPKNRGPKPEPAQRFHETGTGTGPGEPAQRFHGTGTRK